MDLGARAWFPAVVALVGAGVVGAACSASNGGAPAPSEDAGGAEDTGAIVPGADGSADAGPPQAHLRIAHLSPDLPPVDVCVATHGTTSFQGPLLGQLAATLAGDAGEDAGAVGVSFSQVSAYVALTPGPYDVRLVAAGATSCAQPETLSLGRALDGEDAGDAADPVDAGADATVALDAGPPLDAGLDASSASPGATNLPPLGANTYATLLLAGDVTPAGTDPALTIALLGDDATLDGGAALLRAINAVPSAPALDFGLEGQGSWAPLLIDTRFASASAQAGPNAGMVDENGYLPIAPLSAQPVGARPSGADTATDLATATSVEVDLGDVATVIAIGGKTGDAAHPPALLLCIDNQPSGGLLSDCSIAP